MTKKILLLGSGELGKEFVIAAQRLGQYIIACDSYAGAPAMQVADACDCEVFNMLDGDALDRVVEKYHPDIIVPEIEAIRTERLYHLEKEGIQVVPSARAVNFTMNRKAIRDLAAKELDREIFLCQIIRRIEGSGRKNRFPLCHQTLDVLIGQRPVGSERSGRPGTRMALRLRRKPGRYQGTDNRRVHPV